MEEKEYIIYICGGDYDVTLPDRDGEICIEDKCGENRVYLSKADVLRLLDRFN
jgi:hypothetical protein